MWNDTINGSPEFNSVHQLCGDLQKKLVQKKADELKGKDIRMAIHQPGYHRHLYYYYKMLASDIFISLDIAQFVAREWQNRQIFYYEGQPKWLTVPVNHGREPLFLKKIVSQHMLKDHWRMIQVIYKKTPYFSTYKPLLEEVYNRNWLYLNDLCDELTMIAREILKINTPYIRTSAYYHSNADLRKAELLGDCIGQLIDIQDYHAVIYYPRQAPIPPEHYIMKRFGEGEMTEKEKLEMKGISVEGFSFIDPIFKQYQFPPGTDFKRELSIFDLLFNHGEESCKILRESAQYSEYSNLL